VDPVPDGTAPSRRRRPRSSRRAHRSSRHRYPHAVRRAGGCGTREARVARRARRWGHVGPCPPCGCRARALASISRRARPVAEHAQLGGWVPGRSLQAPAL